jgi:hypothetical protein
MAKARYYNTPEPTEVVESTPVPTAASEDDLDLWSRIKRLVIKTRVVHQFGEELPAPFLQVVKPADVRQEPWPLLWKRAAGAHPGGEAEDAPEIRSV